MKIERVIIMSFAYNLKRIRTHLGYKQADLAEELHMSQQAIAKWESGKAEPSISTLRDISTLLNCSIDELLGIDDSNPNDKLDGGYRATIREDHSPVMKNFEKMCLTLDEVTLDRIHTILYSLRRLEKNPVLTIEDKQYLFACTAEIIGRIELYTDRLRTAEEFNETINFSEQNKLFINKELEVLKDITNIVMPQKKSDNQNTIILPIFKTPASAGSGSLLYDDTPIEYINVKKSSQTLAADYILKVRGDSMEPQFYDGDYVLIKITERILVGEIGIFILNGESYIKKMGDGELISLNSTYLPIKLHENDDIRCVGKVLDTIKLN